MEHLHRLVITVGSKGSAPPGRVRGPVPGSRVEGEEAGAFISCCWLSMGGCLPCVAWRAPVTRESCQVFLTEVLMTHVDGSDIAKGVQAGCPQRVFWRTKVGSAILGHAGESENLGLFCHKWVPLRAPVLSREYSPKYWRTHAFAGGWGLHPPDL